MRKDFCYDLPNPQPVRHRWSAVGYEGGEIWQFLFLAFRLAMCTKQMCMFQALSMRTWLSGNSVLISLDKAQHQPKQFHPVDSAKIMNKLKNLNRDMTCMSVWVSNDMNHAHRRCGPALSFWALYMAFSPHLWTTESAVCVPIQQIPPSKGVVKLIVYITAL
jgi:hypothetical protein